MAVIVEIVDRTPKFLPFYEMAQGKSPDERWELWKEHYGLAMVPPGDDGQRLARKLLDDCWDRYPTVMDRIKAGAPGLRPTPQEVADKVARSLDLQGEVTIKALIQVANLEGNAFSFAQNGIPYVVLPVEQPADFIGPVMAHEFTHAVHAALTDMEERYPTTIAERMMMEGIAIRNTAVVYPGLPEESYIESPEEPGWLERCRANDKAIFSAALTHLAALDIEIYHQFIFGPGLGAGLTREVYYAGYRAVQHLESLGYTLADLARVRAADVESLMRRALTELIGQ